MNFHINIPAEIVYRSVEDTVDFYIYFNYLKELFEIKLSEAIDAGNEIEVTINEKYKYKFIFIKI